MTSLAESSRSGSRTKGCMLRSPVCGQRRTCGRSSFVRRRPGLITPRQRLVSERTTRQQRSRARGRKQPASVASLLAMRRWHAPSS